jgi:FkbM family methyltransferase
LKKLLRSMVEKVISALPARRKEQLLDVTLSHIGEVSYYRLAKKGFRPKGIIDIGAYHGEWSRFIARFYPHTPILMIEAQAEKKSQLETVCAQQPNANFELCLLGDKEGEEAVFNVMESGSSLYSERSNTSRIQRTLIKHTLDNVLKQYPQLTAPLLIKLDVQGAELDVLAGGSGALTLAEVVQIEVALMNYNEGAPDLTAVVNFMAARDFLFFDICGFVKPDPKYLSQIDVLFVRKDSILRQDHFVFSI